MQADNSPLRGFKGTFYEGGIRTPMIVSWPAKFAGGGSVDTPVISLDILPTALDAVGELQPDNEFDGKTLLPLLTGQSTTHHETLYWSDGGKSGEWAIRRGDWKLSAHEDLRELYKLGTDPAEELDLMGRYPQLQAELETEYDNWLAQMAEPITGGDRRWTEAPDVPLTRRERNQARKARARRKERRASREEAKRIG
jgi:arylsulfatase A-like enzyme